MHIFLFDLNSFYCNNSEAAKCRTWDLIEHMNADETIQFTPQEQFQG